VGLDKLLSLPPSQNYTMDRKGGRTRGEWRALFEEVRSALNRERQALAEAEAKLDEKAEAGEWKVAPPIGGQTQPGETPLDFGLRQQIRRHRDEIARLERRERDLDIEANLAAVPEDWRE
jgi:hypothetical protein